MATSMTTPVEPLRSPLSSIPSSPRSSKSLLSASSSSFSDASSLASVSPSSLSPFSTPAPSISSKTNAFFASPFSTRPPSPLPQDTPTPTHNRRHDNDPHVETHSLLNAHFTQAQANKVLARLFPSRYKSEGNTNSRREFPQLNIHLDSRPNPLSAKFAATDDPDPLNPRSADPPLSLSEAPASTHTPGPGTNIASVDVCLSLVKSLGQGTFSSVWLAEDKSAAPLAPRLSDNLLKRSNNAAGAKLLSPHPPAKTTSDRDGARFVAVKLTPRLPAAEDGNRTKLSFVREVEILRHIVHPHITPLLAHLTTPTHFVLVLPYMPGGDLLGLVNNDSADAKITEGIMKRMTRELLSAVAWMHSVGIVHRDIKLENILLSSPMPWTHVPSQMIMLTDFGLSRFIDPANPWLTTRCGSEAYAAPELVVSRGDGEGYDGRDTDAWACGVVMYALACRQLPFGEGPGEVHPGCIGREAPAGRVTARGGMTPAWRKGQREREARRVWLGRIAKGEWSWPEARQAGGDGPGSGSGSSSDEPDTTPRLGGTGCKAGELVRCAGLRRVVERLLVRDPRARARVAEVLEDEWVRGGSSGEMDGKGQLVNSETIGSVVREEVE